MCENEALINVKNLKVPDQLLCSIMGDLMIDPVTIESGRTYERTSIERHFLEQKEKAARVKANADSEDEETKDLEEADFMTCPVNL